MNVKDDRVNELTSRVLELNESNKSLIQFKNVQNMMETQYCNLIKRILKGVVDLD